MNIKIKSIIIVLMYRAVYCSHSNYTITNDEALERSFYQSFTTILSNNNHDPYLPDLPQMLEAPNRGNNFMDFLDDFSTEKNKENKENNHPR
jgi:hypothetical protein